MNVEHTPLDESDIDNNETFGTDGTHGAISNNNSNDVDEIGYLKLVNDQGVNHEDHSLHSY